MARKLRIEYAGDPGLEPLACATSKKGIPGSVTQSARRFRQYNAAARFTAASFCREFTHDPPNAFWRSECKESK
jgi:hypothetical protein